MSLKLLRHPHFNSNVIWAATSKQINKWRRHSLRIGNTDMGHMAQSKITFIYNFSMVCRFRICSIRMAL